jgi:hypothetical protein
MTFTNTQTKLGQAITTNDSGDYAVRTIIEGDQTLENLTLTGDLNGGGGHILNEQTTTNMMSKGTVYRFDGVEMPSGQHRLKMSGRGGRSSQG